ncbi:MAG: hypothetical protein MNPFHGCM_02664 [Gemmatimonadaceae bacterium]|nr:hypothetical protein [Gemmatimonadaceae bacterium]
MRSLIGLLWALGGAIAGSIVGTIGAMVFASATNMTSREGASGYFAIAIGLIGAVMGLIAGLVLYGRSAPAGQGAAYSGSGVLGFVALVAVVAVSLWAFMQLRETPLEYDGAQANLELEFRIKSADMPDTSSASWLDVEVQTAKTRPQGTPLWSDKRVDGEYTIIPVIQGPLYRSRSRMIVARIGEAQVEVFSPPMKRTPDPKADWSEWHGPQIVDPPYGVVPPSPLQSKLEVRYRVRAYGQ